MNINSMKIQNDQIIVMLLGAIIIVGIAAYFVLGVRTEGPVVVNTTDPVSFRIVYDQSCVKCPSANPVVNSFKYNGVNVAEWISYHYNATEGAQLIETYGIKQVPAIVISENVMNYNYSKESIGSLNMTPVEGHYVIYLNPPFRNISSNVLSGVVDIYLINDSTCAECYDPLLHVNLLEQEFKVTFGDILVFDVNYPLGEEFVDRYNLTFVPGYVMTGEAKHYPKLMRVWPSVGTIEPNGYFVFRNFSTVMLPYRNLSSGEIIEPA
jgi:thiol-disulfide isomerase/thioredoxin